jgi:hypothetical protein
MKILPAVAMFFAVPLSASTQTSPVITYGMAGRVVAVTGLEEEVASCGHDKVAGTVLRVDSEGDALTLTLRLPGGPTSISIETEGMNDSDRRAMISTLLSKGNSVSARVNICGSGGFLSAISIRAMPPGSPGYPPAPKVIPGGSTFRDLRRFVGKYESSAALRNVTLRRALAGIGLRDYGKLNHYTGVASPVALEGDDLLIAGCAPHQCMDMAVGIVASLASGEVHAAVLEGGIITIYSHQKMYERLPAGLKNWVAETIESAREFGGPVPQVRYR